MVETHDTTKRAPSGREVAEVEVRDEGRGLLGVIRRYPVISATIALCTLLGIGLGLGFLPEDWSVARRILGGALGGAGCGLIVTAPRIVG